MNQHSELVQKSAVRFAKTGPAIYHSHHDLIRFWERAVKRAGLPMRLTQGFNPRPRIVFPHALGLGIASRCEEVELELCSRLDNAELAERLIRASAGALEILSVHTLPPGKKSRQLTASSYTIAGWPEELLARLPDIAAEILALTEIPVERGAPGEKRSLDIRPYLKRLLFDPVGRCLVLELIHTQTGSARPDEVAKLAAARAGADWHDLRLEKTGMTLE